MSEYYTGELKAADLDNVSAAVTLVDREVRDTGCGGVLVESESEE